MTNLFSTEEAAVRAGYHGQRIGKSFTDVAVKRLNFSPVETRKAKNGREQYFWTQEQIDAVVTYRNARRKSATNGDVPADNLFESAATDNKPAQIVANADADSATNADNQLSAPVYTNAAPMDDVDAKKIAPTAADDVEKVSLNNSAIKGTTFDDKTQARADFGGIKFGERPAEQFDDVYLALIRADIAAAQKNLDELPERDRRGLSLDTLRHFGFGYLSSWVLTKCRAEFICGKYVDKSGKPKKLPPPSPRIIIPTAGGHHFNAVATPSVRRSLDKRFWKQHVGKKEFFCDTAAFDNEVVVVVEGEFDAASIWQAFGGKIGVIALCGCSEQKGLLSRREQLRGKKVLVLLDGDKAGKDAAKKLVAKLLDERIVSSGKTIFDGLSKDDRGFFGTKSDPNDVLQTKGDLYLRRVIERCLTAAEAEFNVAEARIRELEKQFAENAAAGANAHVALPDPARQKNQSADKHVSGKIKPEFDELRRRINAAITQSAAESKGYLVKAQNGGYICPQCGSGTRSNGTGALKWHDEGENTHVHCYSGGCGYHAVIFDHVAKIKGLKLTDKDFYSALRVVADEFNVPYDPKIFDYNSRAGFNAADNSDVDLLKSALQDAKIALAEFDAEKDAAFELLRNLEEFSVTTILSDDVLNALGFARAFDYPFFSELKKIIQNYGRQHQNEKVSLNDLGTVTKERAKEIENRYRELITRRNLIQAQINSLNFIAANSDVLGNLHIPKGYEVSLEHGIGRVDKKGSSGSFLVCRRPVIVAEKIFNVEERILNLRLKYQRPDGRWFSLSPVEAAVISNSRKIVDLANSSLPVTTSTGAELVNFLDEFINLNQAEIKTAYTFPRCGWHVVGGTEFFVDGARKTFCADDNNLTVTVDERSEFAKSLRRAGTLDNWQAAYQLAKESHVARMTVAAAVAPPLLKIIGERNFLVYVFAKSRAGKSTALYLAASAVGDEKIIRSFDATKNGLIGVAADVNDFPFIIDEKQVADDRIKEQFTSLIYALANGIGRTKLNRDSTLKKLQDWRTIAIMNGETQFLPDNVTEGANTRLLSIKAPNTILSADDCRQIRHIISQNFGHAFPLVVGKILELGADFLQKTYAQIMQRIDRVFDDGERDFRYLDEHRRYISVITLADAVLNHALGAEFDDALAGAESFATYIFKFIPTATELSSVDKFKDFVRSFVAVNLPRFVGGGADGYTQQIFGKIEDDFIYIESGTLKKHCADNGIDSRKLVADLVEDSFFVPDNKIKKGHKSALAIVQKKIKGVNSWCYRIPKDKFDAD